jgi:hypothetical protein
MILVANLDDEEFFLCPAGFSVPTEAELRADTIEATTTAITNNEKALNSFLKLPVA